MAYERFPRDDKKSNSNLSFELQNNVLKYEHQNNLIQTSTSIHQTDSKIVKNLQFSDIQEGMIVFGRIWKVTNYYIIVSLPGQLKGKLEAIHISENYTALLKKITDEKELSNEFYSLTDLYEIGDHLVCYVNKLNSDIKEISLSIEPSLINQNLNLCILKKKSKIIASIKNIEDHGYTLETGLKNLRAFLPFENVGTKRNGFHCGHQITCIIENIETAQNFYSAKVSVLLKHIDTIETNSTSVDYLIPGIQVSLVIKSILNNGLEVYFSEKNLGYINHFYIQKHLSSFRVGQKITGTLLYILPIIKIAYFSLISKEKDNTSVSVGDVILNAKVLSYDNKGILIYLRPDIRGYIPFNQCENYKKGDKIIFSIDTVQKCKIVAYDLMTKLYICTTKKKLTENSVNEVNFHPGDIIKVTVIDVDKKSGFITVSNGKCYGIIPPDHISDPGLTNQVKVGEDVIARILKSSNKQLFLSLKKSLINSQLPILYDFKDAKIGAIHDGSITKITDQGVYVNFFGNIKGWIPKHFLNSSILEKKSILIVGQTISVTIKDIEMNKKKIILAPVDIPMAKKNKFKIGDIVKGIIIDSSINGVHIKVEGEDRVAFLPAGHMSPCHEIGKLLAAKTIAGDAITTLVFSVKPNLILSTTFVPEKIYRIEDLKIGDTLLCSVKEVNKDMIKVLLPIENYSRYGLVLGNNIGNSESIYLHQILFGKVINIDMETKKINLTIQFNKVWESNTQYDVKIMTAIDVLSCYLNKISELSKNICCTSKALSKFYIGQRVEGIVENKTDFGLVLRLENNMKAIVRNQSFTKNYKKGDKVEGVVIWINYIYEFVEISLLSSIINTLSVKRNKLAKIPIGIQLRGEIVMITDWFILVILKGQKKGTLVTLPVRRHLNDTSPDLTPYQIGNKVRCYGVLNGDDANILMPICMLKSAFENYDQDMKIGSHIMKRKHESNSDDDLKKENRKSKRLREDNNGNMSYKLTSITKSIEKNEEKKNSCIIASSNTKNLPNNYTIKSSDLSMKECGFYWEDTVNIQILNENSSDSDEENEICKEFSRPKRKNSALSEKQLEHEKENKIRKQKEISVGDVKPQTADQFDKLILSSPNSSLIWLQYIAYYLQSTEIEKARAVVKRALKIISFREEHERLNIWKAWLNLESRFGSLDSLNNVFQQAIQTNDAQTVYLHMLNVYIDIGRYSELEKIVNIMVKKFKEHLETWINCGKAFLKAGFPEKSKNIMQRALQSLPKNRHIELLVRFAKLETIYGTKERSQTLFDQILSSYPKRTDIWTVYVDSLIKLGDLDVARKVLDRALAHTLPIKQMKVLLKKYMNIEKEYGSSENVDRLQQIAIKYTEEYTHDVSQKF